MSKKQKTVHRETSIVTVAFFLSLYNQFQIPNFQSPYRWMWQIGAALLDSILRNLEGKFPERPILNTIQVFYYKDDSSDTRYILDGFQRTTTIIILLCVIRDHLCKLAEEKSSPYAEKAEKLALYLHYRYIAYVDSANDERYKIEFNENPVLLENYIFTIYTQDKKGDSDFKKEEETKKTYTLTNAYKMYKHFLKVLEGMLKKYESQEKKYQFLNNVQKSLLKETEIVLLEHNNVSQDFVIDHFSKTNQAVSTLKMQTLVKTVLIDMAKSEIELKEISRQYDIVMSKFRKDSDINTLYKYFFACEGEFVGVNDIPSNVKKYIYSNGDTPKQFIQKIEKAADHFNSYFNPKPDDWKTVKLYNSIVSLNIMGVKQACPIIMTMREQIHCPKLQTDFVKWILKVNMVRSIFGFNPNTSPTAAINAIKVLKGEGNNASLSDEKRVEKAKKIIKEKMMPNGTNSDEFKEIVNGPIDGNDKSNVLLRMIEEKNSNLELYFPMPKNLSLEHIQPQKLNSEWQAYLNDKNSEEVWKVVRELIGNKALMDTKQNKIESSNSFAQKQKHYKNSSLKTTNELGDLLEFKEKERNERHVRFVNILCNIFEDVFEVPSWQRRDRIGQLKVELTETDTTHVS